MRTMMLTSSEIARRDKYRIYIYGPTDKRMYVIKVNDCYDILFGKQCYAQLFSLDAAYELARLNFNYEFKLEKLEASNGDSSK